MTLRALSAVAGAAVSLAAAAEVPDLAPGRSVTVPFEGLKNPLVVRLPDDYSNGRVWPVVFHFHGTGGDPSIDIPLRYTDGNGFILVGMEYITRDLPAATPDYLEREWANLLAVRDALARKCRLDPTRTYVGGFSQGGWFASEIAEVHGSELGGAYILGAGKRPRHKRQPKPFSAKRPVYLGAGQLDQNYIYAVQGIDHFASLGASVTFEDYIGFGHQLPMGRGEEPPAPALRQWFRVESLRPTPDRLRAEAAAWHTALLARAASETDPSLRWLRLNRAKRAPFVAWLPMEAQQQLDAAITALEAAKPAEMAARKEYFALVDRELRGASDGNLWKFFRDQARRYHRCWQSAPESYHGRRAAMEFARLRDALDQVDRWRFPSEEAKDKALADAAANPLPDSPVGDLTASFRALRRVLDRE